MIPSLAALYLFLLLGACFIWLFPVLSALVPSVSNRLGRWLPVPEPTGAARVGGLEPDLSLPAQAAERTYRPSVALIIRGLPADPGALAQALAALDYPADRLEIHLIAGQRAREADFGKVRHLRWHLDCTASPGRIINRVAAETAATVLVFADGRALLHPQSLRLLVRHFAHRDVACVTAERRPGEDAVVPGSSVDARLWAITGPLSELFAVRASFFEPIGDDPLVEDLRYSVRLAGNGLRCVRETGALGVAPHPSWRGRIAMAHERLALLLSPGVILRCGRYGMPGLSHWWARCLRCMVAPACFFLALPIGLLLSLFQPILLAVAGLQLAAVAAALAPAGLGPRLCRCGVVSLMRSALAAMAGLALFAFGPLRSSASSAGANSPGLSETAATG